MEDRVPTKPNRVLIRPEDGSPSFYATMTRADEPTQVGDPLNKNTFLKDETAALFGMDGKAVPNDVFAWIAAWMGVKWKLLAEYNTAGAFTLTVPDDVDELGVLLLGAGGAGGIARGYYNASASGGGSGQLKQFVLKKNEDFVAGDEITGVVGAGGSRTSYSAPSSTNNTNYTAYTGKAGGSSSFAGVTASGGPGGNGRGESMDSNSGGSYASSEGDGQPSDAASASGLITTEKPAIAPYGLVDYYSDCLTPRTAVPGFGARNIFDENDMHIYCGAGGFATYVNSTGAGTAQTTIRRAKGAAGRGVAQQGFGNERVSAYTASAPGDGGGAAASSLRVAIDNGAGADGLVLVYGRKVV